MINNDILKSIMNSYSIDRFIFIEDNSFNSIIICSMKDSFSIERWNNLENILQEYMNKEVSILSFQQATSYLSKDYISKGVVIQ